MFEALKGRRRNRTSSQTRQWRREGHPVRLALLTWPVVVLVGATFAAATCLLSDCKQCGRALANTTLVGNAGSVKSIAFRPDGAMLSSVGVDGSLVIWDMAKRPESAFVPRGVGVVRCAAFSPDNRLLATANANGTVSLLDPARMSFASLTVHSPPPPGPLASLSLVMARLGRGTGRRQDHTLGPRYGSQAANLEWHIVMSLYL